MQNTECKQEMERIEAAASRCTFSGLLGGGALMERDVRVARDSADIATAQLLIIKRSLCPVVLRNYKFLNIGLFANSAFLCHESE